MKRQRQQPTALQHQKLRNQLNSQIITQTIESVQLHSRKKTVHQIISRQSKCIRHHQANSHHASVHNRHRVIIISLITLEVSLEEGAMTNLITIIRTDNIKSYFFNIYF